MQSDLKICQYGDRIVLSHFDYGVVALGVVCVDIFCQHHPLAADNLNLGASLVVFVAHFALMAMIPILVLTVTQKITLHCYLLNRKDEK